MRILAMVILLFSSGQLSGQQENLLLNGSFEQDGRAMISTVPYGWVNYGAAKYSPPDVHSRQSSFFGVSRPAAHGDFFVGLVTRSNNTWESIGQLLEQPLEKGITYTASLFLAKNPVYTSFDAITREKADFTHPVILRIWGKYGRERFLLAETEPIEHFDWKKYQVNFNIDIPCQQIILEVYYPSGDNQIKNGHILLDHFFICITK